METQLVEEGGAGHASVLPRILPVPHGKGMRAALQRSEAVTEVEQFVPLLYALGESDEVGGSHPPQQGGPVQVAEEPAEQRRRLLLPARLSDVEQPLILRRAVLPGRIEPGDLPLRSLLHSVDT